MKKLIDFAKKKRGSASGVSETGSLASGRYAMKDKGLSKLHKASSSGDLSKVKQLAKKSDINQVDKENRTALHFACANGNVDIVAHLVEKKCNINVCDSEKRSALMKAVQCEQDRCVSILLTNGADTTLKDIHGNTALHLACLIPTVSMATQLLEHGADINATNKEGFSPLILAVTKNHYEMAEFLLKRGANVNSMDDSKRTSLMIAADNGQSNIVKLLLKYNADITIRDALGQTAEDYAVLKGHHGCSHLIIEHGTKKKSLQSPLIFGTNKGKAVSMFSTPDHVADVGFVLGGPAMEKEVPDDISQDESVSRTSDKVHSEDLWPSDEDEELDFGPKKPQKLNLAKLVSASQQNKKSAKETSSVDRKQLVTVTQTSKSDSEDDSRDDSEDEVLTNQTSPKSVPDNQASQYPTVPSPNSFSKPPQMTSKPLQDACQDSSEENEEEVDGHKTANNGIPKTSSHPLNNLSFDVSCVAPQSREADTKDVKRDILMSELGFEEVDEKEDTESLWDSEPASESPRKSPASNISSPFAGTASKMHNIFEEEQEDMFYIPSFIRGSRYSKMAKVADARVIGRPEGQMGASENSPNIQPNTCAPSSETQQAAHSALVLPNEEETKKQKSDLLEELGVGDADDIEVEASDWDSVSTSNRNLSQGQAAVSLHQKQVDISQKKVELSPPNSENPSMQGTPGKLQPARLKEEVAVCTPKSTEPSTVTVPVPAPRSVERRLDEPPQSQSSNQVPAEKVDSEYSDWDSEDGAAPSDSGRHLSPPVHKSSPPEPEFRAVIPRDVVNKDDEDEDQQDKHQLESLHLLPHLSSEIGTAVLHQKEYRESQHNDLHSMGSNLSECEEVPWEDRYEKMWVEKEKEEVKTGFKTVTAELKERFGELYQKKMSSHCLDVLEGDPVKDFSNERYANLSENNNFKTNELDKQNHTNNCLTCLLPPITEQKESSLESSVTLHHLYCPSQMDQLSINLDRPEVNAQTEKDVIVVESHMPVVGDKRKDRCTLSNNDVCGAIATNLKEGNCPGGCAADADTDAEEGSRIIQSCSTNESSDNRNFNLSESRVHFPSKPLFSSGEKDTNMQMECQLSRSGSIKSDEIPDGEFINNLISHKASVPKRYSDEELEQDMQKFKNEVGMLKVVFLTLEKNKAQLQKEEEKKDEQRSTKDAAFLKRGVSSRKGGEIVSENIQHKLSEKPHLKGSRRVGTSNITTEEKQPNSISKGTGHTKERQRETQSMRRLDKMYDVEDVEKTKQNMVIQADNKLGITKKQSQLQPSLTNGNPLSAFDDSTLSETSQEEERPEIKLSHAKDKIDVNMDIANDLDDITQSSDTATEDVELPTSAFRNAALQFEQFHMDNMDSRSRIKLQSLIQGYERIIEREKSQYNLLLNKVRQLENEKKELQEGTENTRRLNSALEHQKVEWKSDLNSLNFKLKQEEEKHKNTMLLYEKCQEQLQRKDEQYSMELEAHQQLERNVRNLEMEMRTLVSSMKQIEEERNEAQRSLTQERSARALQDEILNNHLRRQKEIEEENKKMMSKNTEVVTQLTEVTDREKDFSHQNRMLQDEISVLRLELERVRARSQDEEGKYMNENETLKEKAEDLKRDLKLSEEALTQTIFQFNGQLNALKSENTKLNTKLENEKQNREKAETELDSVRSQLTSAVQEMERCQTAKTDIERALQRERDDGLHSQDKLNQEISKLHEMNKHISLQLSKAETKVSSLENDLHRSTLSVTEKTLLLESAQRDLSQNQSRVKEVENLLQLEKDQVSKYNVRQESLQERLAQIQSENMLLRQQLEDAQNKGIIKEKAVSDVQDKFSDIFTKLRTDSERQVHMVEDRNKELINKNNELREQVHRYENEKAEREGTVRQLQQELADALKKLSMSEASLEVITRYRNSLEEEKAYLQKDLDKLKDKLEETEEQYIQSERRIHELKSALDDKEREVIAASQKVQEVVSVSSGMEKTVRQLEEHVQRLEIENAKLEAAVKQQANRTEATQKELQESVMRPQCMTEGGDDLYEDSHVRNRLEDMITSLQGTKINLEEQLNQQIQKQNVLSLSAQDSRNLWEEELKTKSKLGLRLTQLDREKAELEGQVETEKKKAKKLAEQKRSVETTLEREIQRNSELQKDVNKMKALLKTTKKKLKEQETGEQASYFGNIQAEQDHSRYGIENTVSMLKSKVDDFSQRLEMESTKSAQLESSNRELKEQLISLKMLQKSHERLEKSKRQLEDELNNLKRHVEANIMEQSQADQYKREIEERARQEIRQKLEEVNLFLQAQAASQEALEQIRASNEASQRNQMEQRIRDLESELNRAKNTQQDSIIQKETNQSELERYKELYAEELRLRKTLSAKLDRANERLSETNAKLLSERQRTKSIIAGGIVNGSLNSSPSLDVNPFYLTSNLGALNRSLGLGGSFLSPVTDAFPSNNKVDSYLAKMHIELDKNITKELDEATAELNIGSTRISPVGSAAGSSRSLDQDPLTRATQQYLEVLKKNFKI
ncbi:ankyrin repeat domain-containing protein 26-like isoform X2 [Protopterus annectens]|uniref:ankyrin repeat domain-containing protein 26-like isoform X2 n=1 Tax=Protopterus annectens TaxID=7888 RepID=UPI001CFA93F1|nr:ankyrin repeat domain-containing protein 26-like isoform X2 [Protopterus annectens]